MILEIIVYIIFIIVLAAFAYYERYDILFYASSIFALFLIVIIMSPTYDKSYYEQEIMISLDRGSEVSGTFVLGTGKIDTNPAYYYYIQTSKGLLLKSRVHSELQPIYIQERDDLPPQYEHKVECKRNATFFNWDQQCKTTKRIITPTGSIQQTFTI